MFTMMWAFFFLLNILSLFFNLMAESCYFPGPGSVAAAHGSLGGYFGDRVRVQIAHSK